MEARLQSVRQHVLMPALLVCSTAISHLHSRLQPGLGLLGIGQQWHWCEMWLLVSTTPGMVECAGLDCCVWWQVARELQLHNSSMAFMSTALW